MPKSFTVKGILTAGILTLWGKILFRRLIFDWAIIDCLFRLSRNISNRARPTDKEIGIGRDRGQRTYNLEAVLDQGMPIVNGIYIEYHRICARQQLGTILKKDTKDGEKFGTDG